MPKYKVELVSLDEANENSEESFFFHLEADNKDDAVAKAKEKMKKERPDIINPFWNRYETAEEPG